MGHVNGFGPIPGEVALTGLDTNRVSTTFVFSMLRLKSIWVLRICLRSIRISGVRIGWLVLAFQWGGGCRVRTFSKIARRFEHKKGMLEIVCDSTVSYPFDVTLSKGVCIKLI